MKDTYDLQISTNAAAGGLFNQALRSLAGFDGQTNRFTVWSLR